MGQKGDFMPYLSQRKGRYYYKRHVPKNVQAYDHRGNVRIALNTDCKATAQKRAYEINKEVESYWDMLIRTGKTTSKKRFKELVTLCKQAGFTYMPVVQLAQSDLLNIIRRLHIIDNQIDNQPLVEALLGKESPPSLTLSEALERFWQYSKPTLMKKNRDQQRKWKSPRRKAVTNFIALHGDKEIQSLTNLDMVKFRDWWIKRIQQENVKANTANKNFTNLKNILETVSVHEQLNLPIQDLFKKIHLKDDEKATRAAYKTEYIQEKILNPDFLKTLNNEAESVLMACIETGARPIELLNLDKDDIFLDHPVPHIHIRVRLGYSLKTRESERKLPLVGKALDAFKAFPNGFIKYRSKPDIFSMYINKMLKTAGLRPTQRHSLYSFRHSFQNRLNALELPDRLQCQLMGHKFYRPKYGEGASLEHLQSILLKCAVTI